MSVESSALLVAFYFLCWCIVLKWFVRQQLCFWFPSEPSPESRQ